METYLDEEDVGACFSESEGHGLPDSSGAACHERGLPFEGKKFLDGCHGGFSGMQLQTDSEQSRARPASMPTLGTFPETAQESKQVRRYSLNPKSEIEPKGERETGWI